MFQLPAKFWRYFSIEQAASQLAFTCSELIIEKPEQCVKSKVNNENIKTKSMIFFWCFHCRF